MKEKSSLEADSLAMTSSSGICFTFSLKAVCKVPRPFRSCTMRASCENRLETAQNAFEKDEKRCETGAFVDSKVGAISSEKPSPMEGMEPLFKSMRGDWNMLSMKSHHILSSARAAKHMLNTC